MCVCVSLKLYLTIARFYKMFTLVHKTLFVFEVFIQYKKVYSLQKIRQKKMCLKIMQKSKTNM